jgi:hypothetical protein
MPTIKKGYHLFQDLRLMHTLKHPGR